MLNIGITGSRKPLPTIQIKSLYFVMMKLCLDELAMDGGSVAIHHGCCVGADEEAHNLAETMAGVSIHGHPGMDEWGKSRLTLPTGKYDYDILHSRELYKTRNWNIVNVSDVLIACPAYPENDKGSRRSGTWQTVRMARRASKTVKYVWANGEVSTVTGADIAITYAASTRH
jgi:hypothetical protein